jgi:hypothetical protein
MNPAYLGTDPEAAASKRAATPASEIIGRFVQSFDPDAAGSFAEAVRSVARRAEGQLGRPQRIGLSAPGLAARDGRSIAYMPGRLEGLVGSMGRLLERDEGDAGVERRPRRPCRRSLAARRAV